MTAPPAPPSRSRLRRGQGALLREEVLDAVDRLLTAGASGGTLSMRAVAAEAGVSPTAIYLHFADKGDLLLAVCLRHFADLEHAMQEAADVAPTPLEALKACGRAYVHFGLEHPEPYRIMFISPPDSTPASPANVTDLVAFSYVIDSVERAMLDGAVADGEPLAVAFLLWTSVHGIVSLRLSEPDFPWPAPDAQLEHVLDVVGRGLSPTTPPASSP